MTGVGEQLVVELLGEVTAVVHGGLVERGEQEKETKVERNFIPRCWRREGRRSVD
jgi:hypothetical protein